MSTTAAGACGVRGKGVTQLATTTTTRRRLQPSLPIFIFVEARKVGAAAQAMSPTGCVNAVQAPVTHRPNTNTATSPAICTRLQCRLCLGHEGCSVAAIHCCKHDRTSRRICWVAFRSSMTKTPHQASVQGNNDETEMRQQLASHPGPHMRRHMCMPVTAWYAQVAVCSRASQPAQPYASSTKSSPNVPVFSQEHKAQQE